MRHVFTLDTSQLATNSSYLAPMLLIRSCLCKGQDEGLLDIVASLLHTALSLPHTVPHLLINSDL